MINSKKIAVIMPAYNEEKLIAKSINSVPESVDFIYVIDDCSKDSTSKIISEI